MVGRAGADTSEYPQRLEAEAQLVARVRAQAPLRRVLARLAGRLVERRSFERLGFCRVADYARERLGIAPSKARALLRLERAGFTCPALYAAYQEGAIFWVQAHALVPLLELGDSARWRDAWIAWAPAVSVRRLEEAIEQALILREIDPRLFAGTGGLPSRLDARKDSHPGGATEGYGENVESSPFGSDAPGAGVDDPAGPVPAEPRSGPGLASDARATGFENDGVPPSSPALQTGAIPRGSGETIPPALAPGGFPVATAPEGETARFFFNAPRPVAQLVRAVICSVRLRIEAHTGRTPSEGEAVEAMFDHALEAWGAMHPRVRAAHRVFERDGWRCTVPGCTSYRNLQDHHIVFRSAGGSNALENRTTLCAWHHLRGIHAGVVRCSGRAPSGLRFELGLRPNRPALVRYAPGERVRRGAGAHGRGAQAAAISTGS